MSKTVKWQNFLKAANKYAQEAEACVEAKIPIAGLVSARAALEALLAALFLFHVLYEASDEEATSMGFQRDQTTGLLTYSGYLPLSDMTDALNSYANKKLISPKAYEAAQRLRRWGNLIHAENLVTTRAPSIRNLNARIKDLQLVSKELLKLI